MKELERDLEAKVVRYAKARGILIYKFSSPSHRGVCDRILIFPGGHVFFLELKRKGEQPTPLQHKFLMDVSRQGGHSGWADNMDYLKKQIDYWLVPENNALLA